jgi:hypothetical protein
MYTMYKCIGLAYVMDKCTQIKKPRVCAGSRVVESELNDEWHGCRTPGSFPDRGQRCSQHLALSFLVAACHLLPLRGGEGPHLEESTPVPILFYYTVD